MNYIITNKKNCIKLDGNGRPVTCSKDLAQEFEYSKAKNILSSLPRSMKRFMFQLEAVPEILEVSEIKNHESEIIKCDEESGSENSESHVKRISIDNELSSNLIEWQSKMAQLKNFEEDILTRKAELSALHSNIEKQVLNMEHEIELGKNPNVCEGYKQIMEFKRLLRERRKIKDELFILGIIPGKQLADISTHVTRSIEGLKNRTYTYR